MSDEKKLFDIAELFNDDMAKVATALKCCGATEQHKVILHRIQTLNTDKITFTINTLYSLTRDHYNIDGIVSLTEAVHCFNGHCNDTTFDEEKEEQGLLFYVED